MSSGLTLEQYAAAKKVPVAKLKELGLHDTTHNGAPAVGIPYYDDKGKLVFTRKRLSLTEKPKFHQPSGTPLYPYGAWLVEKYPPNTVVVCEGESDFHTLYAAGVPAIALPGANGLKEDFYPMFQRFATLAVIHEPDQGGDAMEKAFRESPLADQSVMLDCPDDAKDPSALWLQDPDPEKFKAKLRAIWAKSRELVPSPFKTLDELMAEDLGPLVWGIDGLLTEGGFTTFAGAPGSYKTWLVLEAILAIASGQPFLGHFKTIQAPVMLLDKESGPRTLQTRFKELLKARELPPNLPIHLVSFPDYTLENMMGVYRQAKKLRVRHVFADSFVRFLGNFDENASNEVAQAFQNINMFKADGISFNFIHHNRKAGLIKGRGAEEMRGSSDILANLNSLLTVEYDTKKKWIVVRHQKSRDAEPVKDFIVNLETSNGLKFVYGGDFDDQKSTLELAKDGVLDTLGAQAVPEMSRKELMDVVAAAAECGSRTVATAIKELKNDGLVDTKQNPDNKRETLVYLVTDQTEEQDYDSSGGALF